MFRHNLLITYRNFLKHKSSFLINLVGLSTGLACTLLIYLWVSDELQMDHFHEQDRQLYQVMINMNFPDDVKTIDRSPLPLAKSLVADLPEVESATSTNDFFSYRSRDGLLTNNDREVQVRGLHASEDFFEVFSFPLLQGNKKEVLANKDGIVLSEELAMRLFGRTEGILGQSLEWAHPSFKGIYQVAGIFKTPDRHSTMTFDFLLPMQVMIDHTPFNNVDTWLGNYASTYLILKKGTNIEDFNAKISDYLQKKDGILEAFTMFVQRYSDRYLHGKYENGQLVGGRITYVRLFSVLALLILIIACVNFMNLSTARASMKMKEIGVKKTIGANRGALVVQFLGESLLITAISAQVALLLVSYALPQFNLLTGKELQLEANLHQVFGIGLIIFVTGLFAGSYPAFYLSGFRPLTILKGKLNTETGSLWVRKGLVVGQFAISIMFIVGLLVVHEQIRYSQTKNMGYDRDNVLCFQWDGELYNRWNGLGEEGKTNEQFESFLQRMKDLPGVVAAANMYGNIFDDVYGQGGITWKGEENAQSFKSPVVGYDFMKTLEINLKQGRSFSPKFGNEEMSIVINESAARRMGMTDPVGEVINFGDERKQIVGVVEDFHHGSLYNGIEPMLFRFDPTGRNLLVKIKAGTEKTTIRQIEALRSSFLLKLSFDFSFLDEEYQQQYEAESRVASLSNYMAALAIIISCLGLLGLAAFTAERRAKEIGIRKILGSSIWGIIGLLSRDFTRMVVLAIVLALPLSYWVARRWLDTFAHRIELQWWYFAVAAVVTLMIAWMTVALQTYQAARVSPVKFLQDE